MTRNRLLPLVAAGIAATILTLAQWAAPRPFDEEIADQIGDDIAIREMDTAEAILCGSPALNTCEDLYARSR